MLSPRRLLSDCGTDGDCPSTSVCCLDGTCAQTSIDCGEESSRFTIGVVADASINGTDGRILLDQEIDTINPCSLFEVHVSDMYSKPLVVFSLFDPVP